MSIFQSIPDTSGSRLIYLRGLDLMLSHFRADLGPCNKRKKIAFFVLFAEKAGATSGVSCQHLWCWNKTDGLFLRFSAIYVVWGFSDLQRMHGLNCRITCYWVLWRQKRFIWSKFWRSICCPNSSLDITIISGNPREGLACWKAT